MVFFIPIIMAAMQLSATNNAQGADYEARKRAARDFNLLNAENTGKGLVQSYLSVALRRFQETKAITASLDQVTRDAMRRVGAASVSAGESGVKGGSTKTAVDQFRIQQLTSEQAAIDNERFAREQSGMDLKSLQIQAESRIKMNKQHAGAQPDYFGNFLQATAKVLGSYAEYQAAQPLETPKSTYTPYTPKPIGPSGSTSHAPNTMIPIVPMY